MALLEIHDLQAAYGPVPILHKIDMHVEQGEFIGVLGHNGMGKTTLLRALMGFVTTTGGSIKYQDQEIRRLATHRRGRMGPVAYTQRPPTSPHYQSDSRVCL